MTDQFDDEEARHRAFVVADPPAAQVRHVLAQLGLPEATTIARLTGGLEAASHRIDAGGRSFVLRRFDPDQAWHSPQRIAREAEVLGSLEGTSVPAPEVLWADPEGRSGCPVLALSWLPGGAMSPPDTSARTLGLLAEVMARVHDGPLPGWRNDWRESWAEAQPDPVLRLVPGFGRVWEAVQLVRDELLAEDRVLAHHDLHPANTLWRGGEVTGVVDWGGAASGFASYDAAYCAKDLALSVGREAAARFLDAWARQVGAPLHPGWKLVAAYGMLGDLPQLPAAYAELGMPTRLDVLEARFDDWVDEARADLGLPT